MPAKEHNQDFTIMIVDDSEYSRKSIEKILTDAGFNVQGVAESAAAAGQIPTFRDTALFIIDIVMPESSGLELAGMISKLDKDNYIIIISSLVMEDVIIESISSGANDIISKPFDAKTLLKAVMKIEDEFNKTH